MVVLGLVTAIVTERLKFGTLVSDPRFLSIMFADMIAFGGLIAAGIRLRRSPAAHKRLMLVATLVLTDAGFGRWLSPQIGAWMSQKKLLGDSNTLRGSLAVGEVPVPTCVRADRRRRHL
jgi:hypothetical protein